jgi:hypothetical protein
LDEGLTTLVMPALNPVVVVELLPLLALLVPLLLLQALISNAAIAPTAVSANVPRLFMP